MNKPYPFANLNCLMKQFLLFILIGAGTAGCKKDGTKPLPQPDTLITKSSQFQKVYIAKVSASNVRNSEGDITVLNNGRYLCAYTKFNSSGTDASTAQIVGKISTDTTGKTWGSEFLISANIGKNTVISASLLSSGPSTIQCYFAVKNSLKDLQYYRSVSADDGLTWAAATPVINQGDYCIVLNAVVRRMNNNRIVIPGSSAPDASVSTATFNAFDYYSDDGGITFTKSNTITPPVPNGALEPSVVQLSGNNLLMRMRTSSGPQYFSTSNDNGTTWTAPFLSTLESSSSPAQIVNIRGTLIAFHNPVVWPGKPRNPLRISKSVDNGATWIKVADMEDANPNVYNYAYPSVTISNGYLLVSYWETIGTTGINLKFSKINISALGVK